MPWKLTISDLNLTVHEEEVGETLSDIETLLKGQGNQGFTLSLQRVVTSDFVPVRREYSMSACSECGAVEELHALSCSLYSGPGEDPATPGTFERLNEFVLEELLALPPYEYSADRSDQGRLPLVEIRQEHLAALIFEVQEARLGPRAS